MRLTGPITILCALALSATAEQPKPSDDGSRPIALIEATGFTPAHVRFNLDALDRRSTPAARFESDFPLPDGRTIRLELEEFWVTGPQTLFVRGTTDERPYFEEIAFDPSRIRLFRGRVVDRPASDVYLALADSSTTGWIDLGPGVGRWALSGRELGGRQLPPREAYVFNTLGPGVTSVPNEHCAVHREDHDEDEHEDDDDDHPRKPPRGAAPEPLYGPNPTGIRPGHRILELAIETDYEYFSLFGDLNEAGTYVVQLYGAISALYLREVNASIKLTFVRLWDNPNDLFNQPDPLNAFASHWSSTMQAVQRDLAQFLSGRRNLPYGGVAYLSGICSFGNGYSVSGYTNGFFATPDQPHWYNQDIEIPAHEIGHNCSVGHTDGYGIDGCNSVNTPPRRGTLMSYCSQTVSGGTAVFDPYFHTQLRTIIRSYFATRVCMTVDCNMNGLSDASDIATGRSGDVNSDGVPDECQDCNSNTFLDADDIAAGRSADVNNDGVPDECQPDCNGNSIPDVLDISSGASLDAYRNGVPDECEQDCDGNGISDYTQIQSNMTLDLDRNAELDACQDCDFDGTPDAVDRHGAGDAWVVSTTDNVGLGRFHAVVGTRVRTAVGGQLMSGQDVAVRSDGQVFVTSAGNGRVLQYDSSGQYVGDFVAGGSGGLSWPTGLTFGPNGNLFVCSRDTSSVLEYDGLTGAFVRALITSGTGGLSAPFGLVFHRNGRLYVTSEPGAVLEFDGSTGAFFRVFVDPSDNGGLSSPRGIAFKPDGKLLVASFNTDRVIEYDAVTGAFLRRFSVGGTNDVLYLDGPWGLRIGPDGHVYVSRNLQPRLHVTTSRILVYDVDSGIYLRSYILGNDTGLYGTAGFDFVPHRGIDCNLNLVPDLCDLSRGTSRDCNANGIPDECEASPACDLDCNGTVNPFDIQSFIETVSKTRPRCSACAGDTNGDGTTNTFDVNGFIACLAQ